MNTRCKRCRIFRPVGLNQLPSPLNSEDLEAVWSPPSLPSFHLLLVYGNPESVQATLDHVRMHRWTCLKPTLLSSATMIGNPYVCLDPHRIHENMEFMEVHDPMAENPSPSQRPLLETLIFLIAHERAADPVVLFRGQTKGCTFPWYSVPICVT